MVNRINKYLDLQKKLKQDMKVWLKDGGVSFDLKWNTFIASELASIDSNYHHPDTIDWNKTTLYDDFYCDKYGTIKADSFIERCEELKNKNHEGFINYDSDKVKQYFMDSFISGFINNW